MTDTDDKPEASSSADAHFQYTWETLRFITQILIENRHTHEELFAICKAYLCEGERIMRALHGDTAVAEMYYRCADAAVLMIPAPPKPPPA